MQTSAGWSGRILLPRLIQLMGSERAFVLSQGILQWDVNGHQSIWGAIRIGSGLMWRSKKNPRGTFLPRGPSPGAETYVIVERYFI
jgi:hypothetical protein